MVKLYCVCPGCRVKYVKTAPAIEGNNSVNRAAVYCVKCQPPASRIKNAAIGMGE